MASLFYANLLTFLIHLCIMDYSDSQGTLELTSSSNLTYIYEKVSFDCRYSPGLSLLSAEIAAYNGQRLIGNISYICTGGVVSNTSSYGVLSRLSVNGCGTSGYAQFMTYFNTIQVQNTDVNCTARFINATNLQAVILSSPAISLILLVSPGTPRIAPSFISANEGANFTLNCTEFYGVPPAKLVLEIRDKRNNQLIDSASGINAASLSRTMSKTYHNTIGKCWVTNHLRDSGARTVYIFQTGVPELTFSNNPVYEYDPITISCFFNKDCLYYDRCLLKIEAFNTTEPKGFLIHYVYSGIQNVSGVFTYSSITVNYDWSAMSISLSLMASRYMELDYVCTVSSYYLSYQVPRVSAATHLAVLISPSSLLLTPSYMTFLDGDRVNITCLTNSFANPAAILLLQLLVNSTAPFQAAPSATGTAYASARLTLSPGWHGANVSCRVLNHNRSYLNVNRTVKVVHVAKSGMPDIAYTHNDDVTLDCGSYVTGFPEPTFQWSVPLKLNITDVSILNERYIVIRRKQSGSFNCTATNEITKKSVTVSFIVDENAPDASDQSYGAMVGGIVGALSAAVAIGIAVGIIRRRSIKLTCTRLCNCVLVKKQPQAITSPGNEYVQTFADPKLATVQSCEAEGNGSSEHVYTVLSNKRTDAEDTYSALDKAFQNSSYMVD